MLSMELGIGMKRWYMKHPLFSFTVSKVKSETHLDSFVGWMTGWSNVMKMTDGKKCEHKIGRVSKFPVK